MNTQDRKLRSLLPCIWLSALCASTAVSSCNNAPRQETSKADLAVLSNVQKPDSVTTAENIDSFDEYTIYHIVVADTGKDYYTLNAQMYQISGQLHWPVDTMNRHYDAAKNNIVLADDDEDEMYRGEYFPRRDASTTLSLEYYSFYSPETDQANIGLIAGIFDQKQAADSMQRLLKPYAPNAFVIRSKVFMGCMH